MLCIDARNLTKEFKVYQSRSGLGGAFRDLLDRKYRMIRAVNGINLQIKRGDIVGYIGENGAGKSTTIKMLTGILQPTGGELRVNGYDPHRQREAFVRTIGVVFGQRSQLWWDIAVKESFRLLQKVYRVPDDRYQKHIAKVIEVLEIGSLLDQPVRKLSLGQRMRCELAAALVHQPSLLFLDEPTIGLDVLVKENIRRFLREINQEYGTTILLTTHDLSDIEALCNRVIMLDKGNIIYDGNLERLHREWGRGRRVYLELEEDFPLSALEKKTVGLPITWEKRGSKLFTAYLVSEGANLSILLSNLLPEIAIKEMEIKEATTEEIIRKIYQEGIVHV